MICLFLACVPVTGSQSTSPVQTPKPSFQSHVRLVLVDIVVTDGNSRPVKGLHKEDFEVVERTNLLEQGQKQTILSFEEHQPIPTAQVSVRAPLPPHVYSNEPTLPPADSWNVLLLDALNTALGDQSNVRAQALSYLKTLEPGPRLAIFTLTSRLRLVEGFTADRRVLVAALNNKKAGGGPQPSPALPTHAEDNVGQQALQQMTDTHADPGAVQALLDFQSEMKSSETVSRVYSTLDVLQQLARYLGGFPGRKNLIWFSGSFPVIGFPSSAEQIPLRGDESGVMREVQKTVNALATAQVAVYPVAAQGLGTDSLYEGSRVSGRSLNSPTNRLSQGPDIDGQNQVLREQSSSRFLNNDAMDQLSKNTGGQAFYNTNGLKEAIDEAVRKGSYYYRISYAPADKTMEGRYRHITVKIRKHHCTLAYRRGYFEEDSRHGQSAAPIASNHLQQAMVRGMPESTEITYKIRVLASNVQSSPGAPLAGDNKAFSAPVTRIGADFIIPVNELSFESAQDGVLHGNLELALVAYDRAGNPLNWIFRSISTSLKPVLYSTLEKTGVQFHQDIDVPKGDLYLRSGVYDIASNKSGTLEIPVSEKDLAAEVAISSNMARSSVPASLPEPRKLPTAPATMPASTSAGKTGASTSSSSAPTAIPGEDASQLLNLPRDPSDLNAYCQVVAGQREHSSAVAKVCEFALSLRKKLPNVICDREMKRHWTQFETIQAPWSQGGIAETHRSDIVTAKVRYTDGHEEYDDVRIDGQAVDPTSPRLLRTWSDGEFATILAATFLQSAKADFKFEKEAKLRSASALVFSFHVDAENNSSYFLRVGQKAWFPEYGGRLWIDPRTFRLLRIERETVYVRTNPITQMKTTIDYSDLSLGDGSSLVLPTHSEVLICMPPVNGNSDNCSRNSIKFTHWHKFRATTKVVLDPVHQGGVKR
jgi:VWFA-related protein